MPTRAPARPAGPTVTVPLRVKRVIWSATDGSCVIAACEALDGASVPDGADPKDFGAVFPGDLDGQVGRNQELRAVGDWETHRKYGPQLRVTGVAQKVAAIGSRGLADWLAETCPGIGPVTARQILDALGPRGAEALRSDPEGTVERLPGLREAQRATLRQAATLMRDEADKVDTFIWCRERGMGPALIRRAWEMWGARTRELLGSDPFLITVLDRAGFLTADELAGALGLDPLAPGRMRAAIIFTMAQAAETGGHTHRTLAEAVAETRALVAKTGRPKEPVPEAALSRAADELVKDRLIVRQGDRLSLALYYEAEEEVAALVQRHAGRVLG